MCLILIAYKVEPKCPLIVAANRDEYFARPTKSAHYWPDHSEIFGGRDLQEMGTWMAVTTSGRFAAVANWTLPNEQDFDYRSRGDLVRDFLRNPSPSMNFVQSIALEEYRGFNLIVYDGTDLVYWSNHNRVVTTLVPGCHVISNTSVSVPSTRASLGLTAFQKLENKRAWSELRTLLGPRRTPQSTDCFVVGETYGTRSSTLLTIEHDVVEFREQQYGPGAEPGSLVIERIPRLQTKRS